MLSKTELINELRTVDLGPISIEIESIDTEMTDGRVADALITLRWGEEKIPFRVEIRRSRSMRDLRNAVDVIQRWENIVQREALIVVPYLNDDAIDFLHRENINGIDLAGNGSIEARGKWRFLQKGFANRFPVSRRSKTPYAGKSALVGRVFLLCPQYLGVGDVQEEIQSRGATISISQVSKVLGAMEEDLVISKSGDGIRLVQPEKLLDLLTDGYRRPQGQASLRVSAELDDEFFIQLRDRARSKGVNIAAYDPQRYVIAPESNRQILIYVAASGMIDMGRLLGLKQASRFDNVLFQAVDEPSIFLDSVEEDNFIWCSPLQVFFQLMTGGKREKETAQQLRADILKRVETFPERHSRKRTGKEK